MEISFEGIGQTAATFAAAGGIEAGMTAALTADSTVGVGKAGDAPCGKVLSVKNGMAAVQISGMAQVSYSGTAPTVGYAAIACDGSGGIKTVTTGGITCLVVSVNTVDKTAVIKL